MKIALIAHLKYPISEPFAGGLEMHTHLLARHLIARGHAVTLFAASGSEPALGQGVTYLGHLGHTALARAVADASVAVITPRWEEPYGLVVAEALACGTSVSGFARGALTGLVDGRTGCLAPADDVPALARAILSAATLSRLAYRARAEAFCDARVMVAGYEALYARGVARQAARSDVAGGTAP